ncbi:MAG: hypothetical protein Q9181_003092, partial [Wetmoreana brouardii]
MAQKRKSNPPADNGNHPKRPRYANDDDDVSANQFSKAQVDPTYGQRSAFPGLNDLVEEDALFYGPASDGLDYLRMVRSEAKGVPNLLTAPKPSTTEQEDLYQDYSQGYYADGAYTAVPTAPPEILHIGEDQDLDPQEAYYASLLSQFRTLKQLLHSSPPPPQPASSTATQPLDFNNIPHRKWRMHFLYTLPTTLSLKQMDQETVMDGLAALEKFMTWRFLDRE